MDTTDCNCNNALDPLPVHNSLKLAGVSYLLGDAALTAAKIMEGDRAGAGGAALWGVGGLAAAIGGNPSVEKQLQLVERKLGAYLKKQGIAVPNNPSLKNLAQPGGVLSHLEGFMYSHPSEILNAVYALGGVMTMKGGLSKNRMFDVASGGLVTAGALAGLLIPEKEPDPKHKPHGLLEKTREWVQEKPLRLSGMLYTLNNLSMAGEAISKYKAGQKSYLPRTLTVASYVFGNAMLGLSSKQNGGNDGASMPVEVMQKLGREAAMVIAAQPIAAQNALVENISAVLAEQSGIHLKAPEISVLLRTKMQEMQLPGAQAGQGWAGQVSQSRDVSTTLSF